MLDLYFFFPVEKPKLGDISVLTLPCCFTLTILWLCRSKSVSHVFESRFTSQLVHVRDASCVTFRSLPELSLVKESSIRALTSSTFGPSSVVSASRDGELIIVSQH